MDNTKEVVTKKRSRQPARKSLNVNSDVSPFRRPVAFRFNPLQEPLVPVESEEQVILADSDSSSSFDNNLENIEKKIKIIETKINEFDLFKNSHKSVPEYYKNILNLTRRIEILETRQSSIIEGQRKLVENFDYRISYIQSFINSFGIINPYSIPLPQQVPIQTIPFQNKEENQEQLANKITELMSKLVEGQQTLLKKFDDNIT